MNYLQSIYTNTEAVINVAYDKISSKIFEPVDDKINNEELKEIEKIDLINKDIDGNRIFEQPNYLVQYGSFFSDPSYIIDNLFLGSAYNAANITTLKKHNIGLIINVTEEISKYHDIELNDDQEYNNENIFSYKQYKIRDNHSTRIKDIIKKAYIQIKNYQSLNNSPNKKNILIHCFMGSSRSASIIIYYMMREKGLTFEETIKELKLRRTLVNPSKVFINDVLEMIKDEKK